MCKGSRVMSQTGCAGVVVKSSWSTLAKLADLQEGRGSWERGQPIAHPTTGSAEDSRGELGLLVEGRARA